MPKSTLDPAQLIADNLNADAAISAETLIRKFVVRWKLFVICALVVPLIALLLAHQIPSTFTASAQILFRHQGGAPTLYREFMPSLPLLSAATAAEVIRTETVAAGMIEKVGVENTDIARPAFKVLFGKVASVIMPLFGRDWDDNPAKGNPRIKYLMLAKELKPTVEATTLMVDRSTGSTRDELIEVTVKSTNREKVAAMANGLCDGFIAEYDRQAREEISVAQLSLAEQAAKIEKDIVELKSAPGSSGAADLLLVESRDGKALSSGLARTISDQELALVQLRLNYTDTSPEVTRAQAELDRARLVLAKQEALDAAKESLNQVRRKQRELQIAAQLFTTSQSGLSVVERALTPRKTKLTTVMKYGIPGGAGLFAGMFIGGAGILLLNLLDPRLFVASDVTTASGLPLLGVVPAENAVLPSNPDELAALPYPGARPALLQTLAKLDVLARNASRIVVVTSAENEASSAAVALQLAALMARDRDSRLLLVDSNFDRPSLTQTLKAETTPGLLDVLAAQSPLASAVRPTKLARLGFLGTGKIELRDEAGSSHEGWERFLQDALRDYVAIVIHAGGLLNSREAAPLSRRSVRPLLVTNQRSSKRDTLGRAAALLAEIGVPSLGVIHCERFDASGKKS